MKHSAFRIEGSTDIGGWSPWLAAQIWQRYKFVTGLEVIAWRWSTKRFVADMMLRGEQLSVTRLHGPMIHGDGRLTSLKRVDIYDYAMLTDMSLLELASEQGLGVLIHAPHAGNGFAPRLTSRKTPKAIWIENHQGGENGLHAAVEEVLVYSERGLPAHLMLDVAHFIEPWMDVANYSRRWLRLLTFIEEWHPQIRISVHLPVGDEFGDSIDLLNSRMVTNEMLGELRSAMVHVDDVVLEYQSPKWRYLLPPEVQKKRVWQRLDQVMDRLGNQVFS
jgi:hypothetical protein